MKPLLTILLATLYAATSYGQTVKALSYNTTNGQVVYSGTNTLNFSNAFTVAGLLSVTEAGISGFGGTLSFEEALFNADGGDSDWALGGSGFTEAGVIAFLNTTNAAITRTNLGATTLGSAIFTAANQTAARQALGLQSYTNTLTNSIGIVEIGSTVSNVTVGWTISPTNASYALRQLVRGTNTNSITNNESTLAFTNLGLTNDTTWTLTVGDGQGVTNTATTTVAFQNYMIWGRSTNTTLSNSNLQTLHTSGGGASRAFATGRSRSITMDGGAQYLYIAYPQGFGAASFTVGGLPNSAWTVETNSYTNASGYATNYLIYRTDTIQNGTGINIVVQ